MDEGVIPLTMIVEENTLEKQYDEDLFGFDMQVYWRQFPGIRLTNAAIGERERLEFEEAQPCESEVN